MTRRALLLMALFAVSGCSHYRYSDPQGRVVEVWKIGNKTEIGEIEAVTAAGDSLKVRGYANDGSSALEKAIDRIPVPVATPLP